MVARLDDDKVFMVPGCIRPESWALLAVSSLNPDKTSTVISAVDDTRRLWLPFQSGNPQVNTYTSRRDDSLISSILTKGAIYRLY